MLIEAPYVPVQDAPVVMARVQQRQKTRPDPAACSRYFGLLNVREYIASTEGRLTFLHFLPGYAPDLNPDELVWSHVKRTGTARRPLQKGEKLRDKIEEQLAKLQQMPRLVRSFFKTPSVAYIGDC